MKGKQFLDKRLKHQSEKWDCRSSLEIASHTKN
jgi:hypothetical protein